MVRFYPAIGEKRCGKDHSLHPYESTLFDLLRCIKVVLDHEEHPMKPKPENVGEEALNASGDGPIREFFGFLQEDREVIQVLIAGVRKTLRREDLTPQQICGLGKLLHGLQRLPRPTAQMEIAITISNKGEENLFYRSLELFESSFDLSSGGVMYTPGVGSDSYTSFSFQVETGGFRSDATIVELEDWVNEFVPSLFDQELDLTVMDGGCYPDWNDTGSDDDWDRLRTQF